ncbi:Hypothetical predicted protein [Podarcis lilfordi]|uniref:Uncharacterized protein n=1 Tax=Podarcis lilfordi TaxID=74358 RepID=A0AA35KZR8_9SAUR|nr:Hypothetical predicted protein [Podarcis lilfordi]
MSAPAGRAESAQRPPAPHCCLAACLLRAPVPTHPGGAPRDASERTSLGGVPRTPRPGCAARAIEQPSGIGATRRPAFVTSHLFLPSRSCAEMPKSLLV